MSCGTCAELGCRNASAERKPICGYLEMGNSLKYGFRLKPERTPTKRDSEQDLKEAPLDGRLQLTVARTSPTAEMMLNHREITAERSTA